MEEQNQSESVINKETQVEYEKVHIENWQEGSEMKCPKSYLVRV